MCTKNHYHMMCGSWDMERDRQNFLLFWTSFWPFTLLTTQKIKIMKTAGDIIILQMCTINENHMMYGSWDMEHDRHNFLSFQAIFLSFYLTDNLKNQNFEKMKKIPGVVIILHLSTTINDHMMYHSWDMERDVGFFVILDQFLHFYLP